MIRSEQNFFGINYIKTDVDQGKIQLVESIFDAIYAKICFIPQLKNLLQARQVTTFSASSVK